jgi:hypothetical protein
VSTGPRPRGWQLDTSVFCAPDAGLVWGRQFDEVIRIWVCVPGHVTRATRRALLVVGAVVVWGSMGSVAHAAQAQGRADSPVSHTRPASSGRKAPSGRPLGAGSGANTVASREEEASASAPPSGGDSLAGNGLNSPLCRDAAQADLSSAAARNCRMSGFEAARAPIGDYAFDVHINTGATKWGNDEAAMVQNLLQFGWTMLVAVVRGVIVVLDWCFTIDLLNSPAMSGVAEGLRAMQVTFTQPWMAIVLAIASVLALYRGLIRRRVAETVGETLLIVAMMAGGLWVIMNPTGTVGALGGWANEASLGTLGAVMAGTPDHPERTLADSAQNVFAAAIDGPWCYLEFGDVSWCSNPARLDPRLRAAALTLAAEGRYAPGQSPALLRGARTNGELFLALPANETARNGINTEGSLFNVLCGGTEEPCHSPTANQAQFRTQSGTGARVIGLLFISFGVLGMLLLLGFIALRLLGAALMSLLYLLLTPAAVLAPALGESGRAAFRMWATRLLGAVTSKLVFSFLLGAVLMAERVLSSVHVFGWLTQWLLISALWWMAFLHRHKAFDFAHGQRGARHDAIARRAREALETPRGAIGVAQRTKAVLSKRAPNVEQRRKRGRVGGVRTKEIADAQVGHSLRHELDEARRHMRAGPETQARLSRMRAQLARVQSERGDAITAGNTRRAAELGARERRIAQELAGEEATLRQARRTVADSESAKHRTGQSHTREQREERARFLDAQAALPAAGRAGRNGERRDYAALAGLAGHGRGEYEGLDPRRRREARAQIDRELAMRKELGGAAADVAAGAGAGSVGRRDKRQAGKELDRALGERLRSEGHRRPSAPGGGSRLDDWKREGAAAAARSHEQRRRSPVMDDAREVAARRKRQLGRDRR